jgi:hypothetical protein
MTIYIIGPSHVHESHMSPGARSLLEEKGVVEMDGYCGIPVWSSTIPKVLSEQALLKRVPVWIVSDYKFSNTDYDVLVQCPRDLYVDTLGAPNNVSQRYMSRHHIEYLAMHSIKVIEDVLERVPTTRLIFWCLYKRTRVNKSSYPRWTWYDRVINRPKIRDHVIDIDRFTNPEEFAKLICDEAGHPTIDGHGLMAKMLSTLE